jgi:peroxiredoxin
MKIRTAAFPMVFLLLCSAPMPARAQTRPAQTQPAGPNTPIGRVLQAYRDVLKSLELTDDQKTDTDQILQDTTTKMRELAPELRNAQPQERRAKLAEIISQTNEQIADKLTDEQKPKFREGIQDALRRLRGDSAGATSRPTTRPRIGGLNGGNARPAVPPAAPVPPATATAVPHIGDPAPDLTLKRLDGNSTKISSARGRILVLIFGSYTSPTFRDKAAKLNKVVRDYRGRNVEFLLVYTAEAFPTGDKEVERNKKDKVAISQHKTLAERQAAAKLAVSALKLDMSIAVDDMQDTAAKTYDLTPNGLVIVGKDGNVAAVQRWMDPYGIRTQLDGILKVTAP